MRSFSGFHDLIAGIALCAVAAAPGYGQEASVEVDTVRARVRPNLEFALPSGTVEQSSTIPIGEASFSANTTLDLITGSVGGSVSLSRLVPAANLTPFVEVGVEATTEPTFLPEATESVDRIRRATVGTRWTGGLGSWELTTELREDITLSETANGSESLDVFPSLAWEVSDLRPVLPERTPETVGGWFRIEVTQRTHMGTGSAVDLRGRIAGLLNHRALNRLRWSHRMELYSPFAVWNQGRSERVGLGGFDSVRGFDEGAIPTRRGGFLSNTVSYDLGSDESRGDTIEHIRFHSLRAVAVGDIAVYQDRLSLTATPHAMAGTGLGIATTVSAPGGIHLDIEAYATIPVESAPMPIIYVRTSLFSLATDIGEVDG